MMRYSEIPLAHTVAQVCQELEIRQLVISPGSRNAPLIQAFTGNPFFECFSVVDERSAAFFALGLAQQSGRPTALVCTSGSALLNYYPAICEAYYSRIPLVVLSADRPLYRIDIGDGQTIRQDRVFERHIAFQANLRQDVTHASHKIRWEPGQQPDGPEALEVLQQTIQAQNTATLVQGLEVSFAENRPVHLNLPFEEPLYGTKDSPPVRVAPVSKAAVKPAEVDLAPLRDQWNHAGRKLVLVGSLPPGSIPPEVCDALAADPSTLVLTETTSNLHHPDFFPSIDSLMGPMELRADAAAQFAALQPDLLLTFGGMVVSKKIKQFLRKYAPKAHWHVDPLDAPDTYYCLERHIPMQAGTFLSGLLEGSRPDFRASYRPYWEAVRTAYLLRRLAYLKQIPFSDFKVFDRVLAALPRGVQVQLANSSTVRYAQLFDMHPSLKVFCNRGTSGIEGSTSTAVGAAFAHPAPTVLISGDLSFFYDANGLWNSYLRTDFRVVVVNNSGGGIFRILPGKEATPAFEQFFETPHALSAEYLCMQHGLGYLRASDEASLSAALQTFFQASNKPMLLEVCTPREVNDRVLLEYFEFLT